MKKNHFEVVVGITTIILSLLFVLFVMKITNKKIKQSTYTLNAIFENIEGINIGTKIKIGGTEIGKVSDIKLEDDYTVRVKLSINNWVICCFSVADKSLRYLGTPGNTDNIGVSLIFNDINFFKENIKTKLYFKTIYF